MRRALVFLTAVLGVVAIHTACAVDVDLTGKGCPCPDDLVCDTRTNTCVTTLAPAVVVIEAGAPPAAACNEGDCKCKTNQDCGDPKRSYCGPAGTCVECLAAPSDTCSAGGYCNDKNQCVLGCKGNDDCTGQKCNTTTHRCVDCIADPDCTATSATAKCSPSGKCAETCTGEGTACGTGGKCCGGLCLQTESDLDNCGACGKVCSAVNDSPSCTAGKCVFKCANGFAHCGPPDDNTGCETNIRTVQNCGACGAICTAQKVEFVNGLACAGDKCTYTTCQQGHYDKDNDPANGCEATCGGSQEVCCPAGQKACNNGDACKVNGTCPHV